MVIKAKYLYRSEYFEAQKKNNDGQILVNLSFNQNMYLFFSVIVFIAIIFFITFGEYTRRVTLQGLVSPIGGMIKVQSNDSGYIEKLFVKDGDNVERLTPLYKIKTERFDESGSGIKERIISSIENQHKLLIDKKSQETAKKKFERHAFFKDIEQLDSEIRILKNLLYLSKSEFELTKKFVDKQKKLLKNNFLSELDYQKQKLDLISKKSKLVNYNLNIQQLEREKQSIITNIRKLDIDLGILHKDLDRQLEATLQSKAEFLYQSDSQVRSPIKGFVASILAEEGHAVIKGQPLLIIIPESEKTFVELYAPSRNVGFMKTGQKVRLRFDAFPYEKFGVQTGTITNISKSSVDPEIIANRRLINNVKAEGLYQIKVELSKSTITVYGQEERFISGMTVNADVELDTRKIYEWIFEPFFAIKGKIY